MTSFCDTEKSPLRGYITSFLDTEKSPLRGYITSFGDTEKSPLREVTSTDLWVQKVTTKTKRLHNQFFGYRKVTTQEVTLTDLWVQKITAKRLHDQFFEIQKSHHSEVTLTDLWVQKITAKRLYDKKSHCSEVTRPIFLGTESRRSKAVAKHVNKLLLDLKSSVANIFYTEK